MKLLVIGTDKSIFKPGAEARARIEEYGRLFEELHIIIYTEPGFSETALSSGVKLYPTNSRFLPLRPFKAANMAVKIIRERAIDLVSVQDPTESGAAGWLAKKRTGLPLHIQVHADIASPFFRRNSWKERMRWWVACRVIPCGDKFRVVSERIKNSLISQFGIGGYKIAVLPIFVDRESIARAKPSFDLSEKYPEFDFIILMVSRLVREKNINLALQALKELFKVFPRTGLVIVGDGPELRNLQPTTYNLQLTDNVRFDGWQSNLVSYYKTADLYLLTSNFEGYSRSVVEAAAAGLPVVMTDVGVAGEVIRDGETGRVVPVGDSQALASTLLDARQNYHRMKAMAKRAQAKVLAIEPRTWEEYLKRYRGSLAAMLNGNSDAM